MGKEFKIKAEQILNLISPMGGCMATDKITVNGERVCIMYREEPYSELDSGWRFLSGSETQEYLDDAENTGIYDVNTIVNYDLDIRPYLNLPIGSELERVPGRMEFKEVE